MAYIFILASSLFLLQHIYLAYLSTVLALLIHLKSMSHCREWLDFDLIAQVLKELFLKVFNVHATKTAFSAVSINVFALILTALTIRNSKIIVGSYLVKTSLVEISPPSLTQTVI